MKLRELLFSQTHYIKSLRSTEIKLQIINANYKWGKFVNPGSYKAEKKKKRRDASDNPHHWLDFWT